MENKIAYFLLYIRRRTLFHFCAAVLFVGFTCNDLMSHENALFHGFNYYGRENLTPDRYGAGYSFYAGVWPLVLQYPGPQSFQSGVASTWLSPERTGNEPEKFYNTIEGGLGWWKDTRFATETPKFIMGGVAFNFRQWANGPGAGSGKRFPNGQRDWSVPGGKYGAAQLASNLLWPPDGLNMEQGAIGKFLGYGYHPLPLTDVLPETHGVKFATGNQNWTLFMNASNFKGPVAFIVPTFWTETVLNEPALEGLFLDARPSARNAFAIEHADTPALIGKDSSGQAYARILPLAYPATTSTRSELLRDIKVYTRIAKWDEVDAWFKGGPVASTKFQSAGSGDKRFNVNPKVDESIESRSSDIKGVINMGAFVKQFQTDDRKAAGFEWNTGVVKQVNGSFVMPEFYRLDDSSRWQPVSKSAVPSASGLLTKTPAITPRPEHVPYLTPLEPDCQFQDPTGPWKVPGPSAGPFTAQLGDGSKVTYYWYRFIDQPAIIYAKLPEQMRQNLQKRVELIHKHWRHTDDYLENPSNGALVGLDKGLFVKPPAGMEIGFVPIVSRQEKDPNPVTAKKSMGKFSNGMLNSKPMIYHNLPNGLIRIESMGAPIAEVKLLNTQGKLLKSWDGHYRSSMILPLDNHPIGTYILNIADNKGIVSSHRIIKMW